MAISRYRWQTGRSSGLLLCMVLALSIGGGPARLRAQDPPPSPTPVSDGQDGQGAQAAGQPGDQGPQVMTRGPIHEAFATPVVHDPAAGPGDSQAARRSRSRRCLRTRSRPARTSSGFPVTGAGTSRATTSCGSAASGATRRPTVSGFRATGTRSTGVISGFRARGFPSARARHRARVNPTYLPPPPKSLETGPNTPQPSPNVAWTPGYWSWQGSAYAWRPGFWAAVQPNWIWMPPHYVWTPSGYLFVAGYWDLPVANRGLMFAPVYYPTPVYAQPGFVFTPSISIVGSAMTANLFVSAGHQSVPLRQLLRRELRRVGITPWFSFSFATGPPMFYDPLFSYYAVINVRSEPGVGRSDQGGLHPAPRQRGLAAAGHLRRTDEDHRAERHDQPQRHGDRSHHGGHAAARPGGPSGRGQRLEARAGE